MKSSPFAACQSDMSSAAFIEPLPVIDFVAQILDKDVFSRPFSDADNVKVYCTLWGWKSSVTFFRFISDPNSYHIVNVEPIKKTM